MRSREGAFRWLLRKEWRELMASRSWWVMLALIGPLVGMSFIAAVRTYAELSAANGTANGVGEAFDPLVGIWGPTFSACELAAAFLLPFVAIRQLSADAQSGALKLELQRPMPAWVRIAAKALVVGAGWLVASAAPLLAVLLWVAYGGSIHLPGLLAVLGGHLLNGGLTIALAAAAAAVTEHPSTAAILTLSVTVGTWILDFVAAVHGGLWERAAAYTPTAMVAEFQHGLVRLDVLLVAASLAGAGLGLAAIWIRLGLPPRRRLVDSAVLAVIATAAIVVCDRLPFSWDLSEARTNSFSRPDESLLRTLPRPLRIDVYLAPEDPRRVDLERHALSRLRRVRPDADIRYFATTVTGLFEQTNERYGEIDYEVGARKGTSRATTAEGVLNTLYELAGVTAPTLREEDLFRGHPLAAEPKGAAAVFYAAWPMAVIGTATWRQRTRSMTRRKR